MAEHLKSSLTVRANFVKNREVYLNSSEILIQLPHKLPTDMISFVFLTSFRKMALCRCTFHMRDTGKQFDMDVPLSWSVATLREHLEEKMGIRIFSLKMKGRVFGDDDAMADLGLGASANVFLNSRSYAVSSPVEKVKVNEPAPSRAKDAPVRCRPPPPRTRGFTKEQIAERVASLEALGFETALCEKALKAACYNLDRAADYLLSGNVPEPLVLRGENSPFDRLISGLDPVSNCRLTEDC
jgi:hypothetical protein